MSNFFNPDNAFFSFMGKAFDMFVVNLLWLFLCIPVVTIIPATTAMYYAVVKVIRRERSYAVKEFFRSFKRNFRQGSIFSLIGVIAVFVMYIDFRYAWLLMEEGQSSGSLFFGIFLVITFLLCGIFIYLCPVLSRFDMKFGGLLKTAFFMSTRHMPTTLVLFLLWVLVLVGSYVIPIGMFIFPVVGTLLTSFLMERVFKKYMPAKEETEGEDSPEKDEWYLE
ncbi:MAG: YesL family protein [Lachnospiraceae bacterium]